MFQKKPSRRRMLPLYVLKKGVIFITSICSHSSVFYFVFQASEAQWDMQKRQKAPARTPDHAKSVPQERPSHGKSVPRKKRPKHGKSVRGASSDFSRASRK